MVLIHIDKWIKHSLQANNRIIWSIHPSVRARRQNKLAEDVTDMWHVSTIEVCRTKQLKQQPEERANCNWQWWHYIQAWHYIQTVKLLVSFWVHLVLFLLAPHKITRISSKFCIPMILVMVDYQIETHQMTQRLHTSNNDKSSCISHYN